MSGFTSEGDPNPGQYLFSLENSLTGSGEHGIHADAPSHMTSHQPQILEHPTSRDETLMQIGSEGSQNASKMTSTQDDTVTTTTQTQPGLDTFPEALSAGNSQVLASEAVPLQDEPMSLEELSPKQPGATEEMEASTTHQEISYGLEEFQSPQSSKYQHSSSGSPTVTAGGASHPWNVGTAGWFHDGNQAASSVAQGGYNMSQASDQYAQAELGTLSGQGMGGVSVGVGVGQLHQKSLYSGMPVAGCTVMSPIPEASQECSSSQTNTNGCTERLSTSQMHSASPVASPMDQTQPRSVSPFRHSALTEGVSSPRSQSTTSEHDSTAQSSATTALRN